MFARRRMRQARGLLENRAIRDHFLSASANCGIANDRIRTRRRMDRPQSGGGIPALSALAARLVRLQELEPRSCACATAGGAGHCPCLKRRGDAARKLVVTRGAGIRRASRRHNGLATMRSGGLRMLAIRIRFSPQLRVEISIPATLLAGPVLCQSRVRDSTTVPSAALRFAITRRDANASTRSALCRQVRLRRLSVWTAPSARRCRRAASAATRRTAAANEWRSFGSNNKASRSSARISRMFA